LRSNAAKLRKCAAQIDLLQKDWQTSFVRRNECDKAD
jgi:hypothetical protein